MIKEYLENELREGVLKTIRELSISKDKVTKITVEPPKDPEMADYSSSVAFSIARQANKPIQEVGERIISNIRDDKNLIKGIELKGGYLNFFLKPDFYADEISRIIKQKDSYGKLEIGAGRSVLLEFVSANPTGPLHVGHGRGAVFGDTLSRILRCAGFNVTNEYYINDAGNQVVSLGRSIASEYFKHFGIEKESGEYRGEYIGQIADSIIKEFGDRFITQSYDETVAFFSEIGVKKILDNIREDLKALNIHMDSWVSERDLYFQGKVDAMLNKLKEMNLTYEKERALWFASTKFGDSKDRVLIKADGEKTYFSSDIAYHYDKFRRGYDFCVNIWGADHHGYLPRLKAAIKAIGDDPEKLNVIFVQMVHLTREGKPVQMSKRAGEYITLRELVDEVRSDATRFFFLMREPDSSLNFDIELAKKQSADNPVYYVQYAHARIASIFREATSRGIPLPSDGRVNIGMLNLKEELRIIRMLIHYKDEIERSARMYSCHNISYYLIELANEFHKYYNSYRVLDERPEIRDARLNLVMAVKLIINMGLNLLGVSAPEQM